MSGWSANYINNPNDDYNLTIELLYNNVDIAVIYKNKDKLELKFYANNEDMVVPIDWLSELLENAKKSIQIYRDIFIGSGLIKISNT